MLQFLALPTVYLPVSASLSRLTVHLQRAQPFHLKHSSNSAAIRTMDTRTRVEKAAERMVKDGKLSQAVRLLMSESEKQDDAFEVKVEALRHKFMPRVQAFENIRTASTPSFSADIVITQIRKMNKNSATAIDGWTRDLLLAGVLYDSTIAEALGVVLAWINDGKFDTLAMDCLRAGRLVAVPKLDGGIRPITVSNALLKLLGSALMARSAVRLSPAQYAVGSKHGAATVIHQCRAAAASGKAVIKIDSTNAFNVCPRHLVYKLLADAPDEIRAYFETIYALPSAMVVFGPGHSTVIEADEGIRQGDALSAYFFGVLMDAVAVEMSEHIRREHPGCEFQIFMYMDDMTIVCPIEYVEPGTQIAQQIMLLYGLRPNLHKSAVLMPGQCVSPAAPSLPVKAMTDFFRVLGSSVSLNHDDTAQLYTARIHKFFSVLRTIRLHPQIVFTVLRICGRLKILYLASTTPPTVVSPIADMFHQEISATLNSLLHAQVPVEMLYDKLGCGMVDYREHAVRLYEHSRLQIKQSVEISVGLTTNSFDSASMRSQHDAQWLFYGGSFLMMTESQFVFALAIRLRVLPVGALTNLPVTCWCTRAVLTTAAEVIEHYLICDQASPLTKTHRHNAVRNALAAVARSFGVHCQEEPTMYADLYQNGHQRPDIVFFLHPPLVTDVSIVYPETEVNVAADKAATEKIKQHTQAVAKLAHRFLPFVMETFGHFHPDALKLIDELARSVFPHIRKPFALSMRHATSTALAMMRADVVRLAIARGMGA